MSDALEIAEGETYQAVFCYLASDGKRYLVTREGTVIMQVPEVGSLACDVWTSDGERKYNEI
jgi:hypothetical protein